ncbi:hypothetical protein D3C78_1767640 [compost metagenome]
MGIGGKMVKMDRRISADAGLGDRRKSADAMGRPQSADLLDKGYLVRLPGGGRSTRYRIAWGD